MRRFPALVAAATLVFAAQAAAKGPTKATITGPGLSEPIRLDGNPESDGGSLFGQLVELGGWFAEVFEQSPDSTVRATPTPQLGPRYDAVYVVPTGSRESVTIRQELYPFAKGGPVTHVAAGQPIFGMTTHGGWYRAPATLGETLVALGLPETPLDRGSGLGPGAWAGIAAGGLAALSAAWLGLLRRRSAA